MSEISDKEIKAMTKEQNYIRGYKDGYIHGYKNGKSDIDGIKAEIKTEISDYEGCADFNEGIRFGLRTALEIIDKYKAETEAEDGSNNN